MTRRKRNGRPSLEELMFGFAQSVSRRATCSRLRVGTVIASLDLRHVLAYGYNGNAAGEPNACSGARRAGSCECVHAELNALLKLKSSEPCHLFTTIAPCLTCAKCIVNSVNVQVVSYLETYRDGRGLELLVRRGIAKS